MSVEALCRRVTDFGFRLLANDFALDARQHKVERLSGSRKTLMWVRDPLNSLMSGNPARLADYLTILENQEYSYLMRDGGVFQISYVFDGAEIERHRLCYHPCPFALTFRDIRDFEGGLLELIQNSFMDRLEDSVLMRTPIRFDFAPDQTAAIHPASHITLNDPSCRVPAKSPLTFDTFIKFILENFYFDIWENLTIREALVFRQERECLSDDDRKRAYLSWSHA
ncbi:MULTISPECIES: DUF2290 domain-containing protein [unclassified Bradyrhizobium]|uniref:DUF2290 domain-containing protein n=1 Tax=unclassified Bradyrhizobium TaxID=2631580 RepID=UPI0028EF453B|nr:MULTISPECIES: DUF2290 domain-containing protein [unclassified Bradyrhizobium]